MGIDRAAANAVQALELPRGAQVISLDVKVECAERQDESNENWGRPRDNNKCEPGYIGQSTVTQNGMHVGVAAYLERS